MKIDAQGGTAKPKAHRSEVVNPTIFDEDDDAEMKDEAPARKSRARSQPQRERPFPQKPMKNRRLKIDLEVLCSSASSKIPEDFQPATAAQPRSFHKFAFDCLQATRAGWTRTDQGGQETVNTEFCVVV